MIKVLYITGQSFSGSTLLCALLGTQPQLEPVSELSKWTTGLVRNFDRTCACGKKVSECEYWCAIGDNWSSRISLNQYVSLQNKFEHISSIWRNRLINDPKPSREFGIFKDSTVELYRSIITVSNRPIIVDSSKLPGKALALAKMVELDVSIIHLVRNGIHFLKSSLVRGKMISKNDTNILYKSFLLGLNWAVTNITAEYALQASKCKGLRIRYEDLISDPISTVNTIGLATKIDTDQIQEHIRSNKVISYRHMASGSNHRSKEPKPITNEFNITPQIDNRLKVAFKIGAGLLLKRYGYL